MDATGAGVQRKIRDTKQRPATSSASRRDGLAKGEKRKGGAGQGRPVRRRLGAVMNEAAPEAEPQADAEAGTQAEARAEAQAEERERLLGEGDGSGGGVGEEAEGGEGEEDVDEEVDEGDESSEEYAPSPERRGNKSSPWVKGRGPKKAERRSKVCIGYITCCMHTVHSTGCAL